MSKKKILGIDIGQNSVKLAQMSGNTVLKTVSIELPDRLVQNGRVISIETMSELIRGAMKENHISCRHAACTIGGDNVFVGVFTVPTMTHEQLQVNLPYEFRDFITEDLKNYTYDYAVISSAAPIVSSEEGESESKVGIKLMAVAAPTELINELKNMVSKCGMKLDRLAPAVSALIGLHRMAGFDESTEYCVLDVGQRVARLHIFRGSEFVVTRIIESGIASIEEVLADSMDIDIHLAHTYVRTNYKDCVHGDVCTTAFNSLALDIMRVLNFYRFSNPDNKLEKIYLCGGGAEIGALTDAIRNTVDLPVMTADEMLPIKSEDIALFTQAIGITMD